MILVDSGAVYAMYDSSDAHHSAVVEVLPRLPRPLIIPTPLLSEIDYLLEEWIGVDAAVDFLESVLQGYFHLEPVGLADLARCKELIETYRDLKLGFADSAVTAVAERLGINQVLTVDERHFRAINPRNGPFRLIPSDS